MSKAKVAGWNSIVTPLNDDDPPPTESDPEDTAKAETPEELRMRLDREDAATRASIPSFNGVIQPEPHPEITEEQMRANPSNYQPALEEQLAAAEPARTNPSVIVPTVAPATEEDERQQWVCLQEDGIRTGHPVFRSNVHLINNMVQCPQCETTHVRRLEPGESA